jgi:Carboxypeptidase regulatory-like domain
MRRRAFGLVVALVLLSLATASLAYAQGGSLSGVVVDTYGGIIPGVNVVVKNNATGTTFESVTNAEGLFSVPALDAGVYTVTVSLTGFKTSVLNDVRIAPGVLNSIKATVEVGSVAETVNVTSSSEIINTQTATISATLNVDQINLMPTASRNALNAVTFLPGVNTTGINRNSTINGLPESFINITLDGISNNDNFNKSSDGFFASVTPRQDAIEAVTVTTAVGGADVGGSGATGINFATRSGTDRFTGSVYEYYRAPELNTNYWFNERNGLPKNDVTLNQYGGRSGGPIVVPGLYDGRGKAFYFFNYEQLRLPNNLSRTRTVLNPRAQQGWFRYLVGTEVREVNVLQLAAANRQLSAIDPMVTKLLGLINSASASTGTLAQQSDPLLVDYTWQSPGSQFEHQPVVRIDYNLGQESIHRLTFSSSVILNTRDPDHLNNADRRFPASTNYRKYTSRRPLYSLSLRSTLTSNIVNELRGGITRGGSSHFGLESSNGVQTFQDQDGYAIDFDSNIGLTNWWNQNTPSWRSSYVYSLDETLSWQRGKHSISFGGAMLFSRAWEMAQQMVPGIQLGFDNNNDPALGLFTGGSTGNFRDASAGELTDARELYGLLTGRVISVTGQAALDPATNHYAAFAARRREGNIDMHSAFAQDSWRLTPTLTLNAGVRWDVQLPFSAANDTMSTVTMADVCGVSGEAGTGLYDRCRFLTPGASGGKVPTFQQLTKGTLGYKTDWNNVAPNIGLAWRPNVQSGLLRTLLGEPDQATLRGGYSIAYERQGIAEYTGVFGVNPGSTLSLTRNASTGLVNTAAGEKWPVLLSERNRLYNAPFPETPTYPIPIRANRADSIQAFNPDVKIANARTWTVSFQRALTRDTAIDIRYVGTRGVDQWSTLDYNDIRGENLVNNGFLAEFRVAQANLQANNVAGGSRAGSLAYFGPGTGTSPLPIYFAYLIGRGDPNVAANYTGGTNTWANTTFAQRLVRTNPAPIMAAADDLDGNLTRRTNALNAGLAANFFVLNPDANEVNVTDSGAYSDYHALQIQLRRRLSRGFQIDGSYQYALEGGSAFLGFSSGRVMNPTGNVRHAIKTQWDWTIPVGRDQRFGSNLNPILNGILGGWQFNGVGRIQSRTLNLGNVRLVGMSVDELTKMYKFDLRVNPDNGLVTPYMLPDDVILNTRRAFSVSTTSTSGYSSLGAPEGRYIAPPNGPDCIQIKTGDCAPRTVLVRAPWFTRFDVGITKRFPLRGSMNFEFKLDVLNVFDNVNFNPAGESDTTSAAGTSATIFQATSAYQDLSNTFDPGGRLGQLMFRLNW